MITTHDRPRAWDWDGPSDLSSGDRAELDALREELPRALEEVQVLRGEVAAAADAADLLRETLRRVAAAGPLERRRLLRSVRREAA